MLASPAHALRPLLCSSVRFALCSPWSLTGGYVLCNFAAMQEPKELVRQVVALPWGAVYANQSTSARLSPFHALRIPRKAECWQNVSEPHPCD